MNDYRNYIEEQFEKAKQAAIDNDLNEVKVIVTLKFEFTIMKPKDGEQVG